MYSMINQKLDLMIYNNLIITIRWRQMNFNLFTILWRYLSYTARKNVLHILFDDLQI
jgi:hypothetical protein